MKDVRDEWFEASMFAGKPASRVSKFLRKDFNVSVALIEARWPLWSAEEKLLFAGAYAARIPVSDGDQQLLDYLMQHGDPLIWRAIAHSVARHRDRDRALRFLLERVGEGTRPLSNYYQALQILSAPESVPALVAALSKDSEELNLHPSIQDRRDRLVYSDYLYCSATLFRLTGLEQYRANLKRMLAHPEDAVRQRVVVVADWSGVAM